MAGLGGVWAAFGWWSSVRSAHPSGPGVAPALRAGAGRRTGGPTADGRHLPPVAHRGVVGRRSFALKGSA